jgi:dienelactone hydrolase
VLAVDFFTPARVQAGFGDLVAALTPSYGVWENVQPAPAATLGELTGEDYLSWWTGGLPAGEVRAVLGFCAGGIFAAALAERIGATQGRVPEVVLFDPELPTSSGLFWLYHKMLTSLAAVLTERETADAVAAGKRLLAEDDSLTVFAPALVELYREVGWPAFRKAGLDERRSEEVVGTFSRFVAWLLAADQLDVRALWRGATAVTSPTWTGTDDLVGTRISTSVEHPDLLRSPEVATAVAGLVGR